MQWYGWFSIVDGSFNQYSKLMNRNPLDQKTRQDALASLPSWTFRDNRLVRTFEFENFREAVAFIVHIGFHADHLDHHPILYNVYNKVTIELTTHSAGNQVTQMDVLLAQAMDKVFDK